MRKQTKHGVCSDCIGHVVDDNFLIGLKSSKGQFPAVEFLVGMTWVILRKEVIQCPQLALFDHLARYSHRFACEVVITCLTLYGLTLMFVKHLLIQPLSIDDICYGVVSTIYW
ncbi:hypothetical protein [Glaciecola sp. SC05]|uniref:hypothetical protein n=1 Tax=Glaciecola sp. SC05 TaxID=1987355 RepID=UPI0035298A1C